MPTNYRLDIDPARTESRQNGKDACDKTGYTIGETVQVALGHWDRDADYCFHLKNERKEQQRIRENYRADGN